MENYQDQEKLTFIIDGTSLNVHLPGVFIHSRAFWVNYKKHSTWRYFVFITPSGKIGWGSNFYVGEESDDIMYDASKLKETLEKEYPEETWGRYKLVF